MDKASGKVTIYTTALCGFCHRAKSLLEGKDVSFEEIDVTFDPEERAKMIQRANGARTVPQIFICEQHIGGCDDLYSLEYEGKLDPLLIECLNNAHADMGDTTDTKNAE